MTVVSDRYIGLHYYDAWYGNDFYHGRLVVRDDSALLFFGAAEISKAAPLKYLADMDYGPVRPGELTKTMRAMRKERPRG